MFFFVQYDQFKLCKLLEKMKHEVPFQITDFFFPPCYFYNVTVTVFNQYAEPMQTLQACY